MGQRDKKYITARLSEPQTCQDFVSREIRANLVSQTCNRNVMSTANI